LKEEDEVTAWMKEALPDELLSGVTLGLTHIQISKLCITSLDAHYIKSLFERAHEKRKEFQAGHLLEADLRAWCESVVKDISVWVT
jgi:hypothetical protein